MIEAEVILDKYGILHKCSIQGHANAGKAGTDIVCAAVSVLTRTAISVLSERKGISIRCDAPEPGFLDMEAEYTDEGKEFLSTVGVFLVQGIESVAMEYPQYCKFKLLRRT